MFDNLRTWIEDRKVDEDNDGENDNEQNDQMNYNYHSDNNCHNRQEINEAEPSLKCNKKENIGARTALKNIQKKIYHQPSTTTIGKKIDPKHNWEQAQIKELEGFIQIK